MEGATSRPLKASAHVLIVQPSLAKDDESRTNSGLFIPSSDHHQHLPVNRGVILDIGAHLDEPNAEVGGVVHYQSYVPIGRDEDELHVVGQQYALAFELA